MKMRFRLLLALSLLNGLAASAFANDPYPSRPVTIVNPYAPGGPVDVVARDLAQALFQSLGQPFIVVNKAGGNGTIGTIYALSNRADGYTLLLHTGPQPATPALPGNKPWDGVAEFEPIGQILATPNVLLVGPHVAAKTLKEFIDLAKSKPGQITLGYPGSG